MKFTTLSLIFNFNVTFPTTLDSKRKELMMKLLPTRKKKINLDNKKMYILEEHTEEYDDHETVLTDDDNNDEHMDQAPECQTQ